MNTTLIPAMPATVAPSADAVAAAYAAFEAGDVARAVRLLAWTPTTPAGDDTPTTTTGDDTPTMPAPRPVPVAATLPSPIAPSEIPDVCCRCAVALEKRNRRRARAMRFRELGINVVTLDGALLRAARAALRNAGDDPTDEEIAQAWVTAIGAAGVPLHAPWAGLRGHMQDALAHVWGEPHADWKTMATRLNELAGTFWAQQPLSAESAESADRAKGVAA